jgi:nicotinate-nucleotide adenylyltransferase
MPGPPNQILLVTPVWNDSARLTEFGAALAKALAASPLPVRWIIADDGSHADEHARLVDLKNTFARDFPQIGLHFAAKHHGKGAVVREAWALAPDAAWFAFVDADGSVTADCMLELLATAVASDSSVLGIRKRTATTEVVESFWRGLAHRGFLLAAHLLLDLQCEDPQCGAKIFRGADYRRVAGQLAENGLAFDSELLSTLKRDGSTWAEIPVNWVQKKGGKVHPLRDAWGMFAALLRIRAILNVKKIALFGGTFDPVHLGHVHLADAARQVFALDEVRFLPCQISPHKTTAAPTSAAERLEMLRLATAGLPWAVVDDCELHREGPSFSYQTAEAFAARFPKARLFWIMGGDQWDALPRWRHPERLAALVEFIVLARGRPPLPRAGYVLHVIEDEHPASATAIREAIAHGATDHPWLAPAVSEWIAAHGLYKG